MSSNVVKIAIGAALALLVVVVVVRSGNDSKQGSKPLEVDQSAADAVRQRLGQPHAQAEPRDADALTGDIKVDAKAPAPAKAVAPGRPAAPAAPAAAAQMPRAPGQPAAPAGNAAAAASVHDPVVEDLPTLKAMALSDKDPDKRLEAITLLGASEEPEVVPVLGQALSDEDAEVRLAAIQALADFTGDSAFDLLGKAALSDPEADNRYEALEALSDTDDERANVYAKKALAEDTDEEVRELAGTMLGLDADGGAAPAPAPARR